MAIRKLLTFSLACMFLRGADSTIQPVGLVIAASAVRIRRAGDSSWTGLSRGEMVEAGDEIAADPNGDATIAFCPTKSLFHLEEKSSVAFAEHKYTVMGRQSGQAKVPVCTLPLIFVNNHTIEAEGESQRRTLQGPSPPAPSLPRGLSPEIAAEVAALSDALQRNPLDVLALLARADIFRKSGLNLEAGKDVRRAGQLLGDPAWIPPLESSSAARSATPVAPGAGSLDGGTTYALVVGVSTFKNLPDNPLLYTEADAFSFRDYLHLKRGGALKDDVQLKVLTGEAANKPGIENAMTTFLMANAKSKDTVILFIATHGVIENKTNDPYLLSNESDLEKLPSTAVPMRKLLDLLNSEQCHAGRVLIFVDVCHADRIGDFRSRVGTPLEKLLRAGNESVFAFASSRASEVSKEGAQYGGGHGAFSYFLLRGLNTNEPNGNGPATSVTLDHLIQYVHDRVRAATKEQQNPTEMGALDRHIAIVTNVQDEALTLLPYPTGPVLATNLSRGIEAPSDLPPGVIEFRRAIAEGRVLPGEQGNAFERLPELQRAFGTDRAGYLAEENRLRVALESAGEKVLLEYLKGDEVAQSAIDFEGAGKLFEAAFQLTPEALTLQANALFCRGRALVTLHQYGSALPLLEHAAKLAPQEAYVWNALGIAYLQIPDYAQATSAFQDAIRRAPFWAYPRHNLALAFRERGNLRAAIEQYLAAMQLADYSYLRYNLGLIYQQINDRNAADLRYQEALKNVPNPAARARILIAQATLESARDRTAAALRLFDRAEALKPETGDLFALRHDKALLLARDGDKHAQAEALWMENLRADPSYLPSMLGLAEALEQWKETDKAASWYAQVLSRKPDYVAARIHLAALQPPADATRTLEEGIAIDPHQAALLEPVGDLYVKAGETAKAVAAYCKAGATRKLKILRAKLSSCPAA